MQKTLAERVSMRHILRSDPEGPDYIQPSLNRYATGTVRFKIKGYDHIGRRSTLSLILTTRSFLNGSDLFPEPVSSRSNLGPP
jgi:hypothetical protein